MAYSYDQIFAADPANPSNIAQNAAITIFAPGDVTMTPLTITDPDGQPLANPIPVNANGFGSAFAHATLDRVAWAGGGFTGFFTSYDGMKEVAVAAQVAAETAAAEAATAGAAAAAEAGSALAGAVADAEAAQAAAESAAALVGAPADTAMAAAANNSGSQFRGALNATYAPASLSASVTAKLDKADAVPKWKATTVYASGDKVIAPTGEVVSAKTGFTSGATYSSANWNYPTLNRGAALSLNTQSTVYTGPNDGTNWTYKQVDGVAATGAWAVTSGVLSGLPTGAKAEVGLRPETIRHGRIGALIKTRDDATGTIWTGLVARETATQRLVVFLKNGVGGTGRQVQVWPMTGGSFGSQIYGSTLPLNGAADTQETETWTDLEVEIAGDTLRIWVNGQRIGGDLTIPAGLDTSGQVGVFSNNARESHAAEFKAMRVHSFDVRRISPAFVKGFAAGSSQTAGYGLTDWANQAWPNLMPGLLLSRLNSVVAVQPGGVSGENTVDMIVRVTNGLTNHNPQVVFIENSINDAQISTAKSQTPAQTLANIKTMVNDVIAFGATPVILTSAPMNAGLLTGGFTGASWSVQMESNGLVRQYAAEAGILLVDLYRAFGGIYDSTYLQADNLHWNATGHALVAATVTDVLLAARRV